MNKRPVTFEDVSAVKRFTGGDYCQAKGLVAYAAPDTAGIMVKNMNTGDIRKVSVSGRGEGSPQFTFDGSRMMFLSVCKSGRQLFVCDTESWEPHQLTHFAGPIMEAQWSPDGKQILFTSQLSGGGDAVIETPFAYADAGKPDEAVVIEDFGYKFDGMGFIRPDGHLHLFICDAASGEVRRLTEGTNCDYLHAAWAPDSRHVVCASDCNRASTEMLGYDLMLFDTAEDFDRMKQISKGYGIVSYPNPERPVFTPDGKYVIMGAMNPHADFSLGYPEIFLMRFPVDGGDAEEIFIQDEECFQCIQFPYNAGCGTGMDKLQMAPDGKSVYFISGWMGQCVIYRLDISPDSDKHARKVLGGKQACHGIGRIQNGKMLIARSTTSMAESYEILDLETGELTKAAQSAEKYMEELQLTETDDFMVETSDGKDIIHGWVLPPAEVLTERKNSKETGKNSEQNSEKKYPVIVYVHGGPHPFYTYGLTMEFQAFSAAGFGILYCNPRGSSGYGIKHQMMYQAEDGTAFRDIMQFTDEAIRRYDWIDPDRLGMTGGSYGGWMTNYVATHPEEHGDRFKAYITQRCVASDMIGYASSDMQGSSLKFDSYEEFMLDCLKKSHVSYAEKVDKPFLILHGQDDYRCPVEGAHQLFIAIKDTHPDLPVKLVVYPHVSHDQPSDPKQLMHYYHEMVTWFKKYL